MRGEYFESLFFKTPQKNIDYKQLTNMAAANEIDVPISRTWIDLFLVVAHWIFVPNRPTVKKDFYRFLVERFLTIDLEKRSNFHNKII